MANEISEYLQELTQRMGQAWNRFWYAPTDPLTLSLLRICTGICAIYFVASHSADLVRWFAPDGILNANTAYELSGGTQTRYWFHWSFLYLAENRVSLWTLHSISLAILLAYTLGLWSRLTSIGALAVVLSYIHRAPMLTGQFEPVLSMCIAYLCIAPTGRYLALDTWLSRRKAGGRPGGQEDNRSVSANIATRLLQLHLAGFCILIGLSMLAGDVWWAGEGVWWLIARTQSSLIDLSLLANWPLVINLWTHAIVVFHLLFGLLIWRPLARPLLLVSGIAIWTSMALITGQLAWCAMMMVTSLAFVDPRWIGHRLFPDRFAEAAERVGERENDSCS